MADTYTPQNTDNTLFIENYGELNISHMITLAMRHFGDDFNFEDFSIRGEKIHTRCINYDLYDPLDWDDYIIITRKV